MTRDVGCEQEHEQGQPAALPPAEDPPLSPAHDLFRQEALEAETGKWLGSIRLATPLSHSFWAFSALAIGTSIVVWLLVGHYTRREHVDGVLVPKAGLLTVSARAASTVTTLNVAEGALVRTGDPLLTLSGERSSASLGDTSANISAQLRGQKDRLEADLADILHLADQQSQDLQMQQSMLQWQVHLLNEQMAIEQRQAASLTELLAKFQPLRERGFVSPLDVQREQSQEFDVESRIKSISRERSEAQRQSMSLTAQLAQLPLTTQAKLSALKGQIAQIEQTLDTNEADRATTLRAPGDGLVSSVLIKPGQSVMAGQSLLAVVPHGSPLQAQLLVPSSAIGFVRVGTKVALHYQAFPFQKFGIQHGRVASISRSALTPREVTALVGQEPPKESLYRVDVTLASQTINAYGREEALKPSMALDADLLLDQRRVIEWIFEPLYGMGRRYWGDDR